MRKYLLLFCLSLPFMSYADVNPTKPNGLPNASYPDLRPTIDRHIAKVDGMRAGLKTMELEIKAYRGSADVTAKRNYPIVPYDPNHPNVKKQAKNFKLPVKAGTIAKNLGRGLNAAALGLAVYDLLGAGVDYVLDPDNNRAIYYPQGNCWSFNLPGESLPLNAAAVKICENNGGLLKVEKTDVSTQYALFCNGGWGAQQPYSTISCGAPKPAEIPLDELAAKVIEQAEQGNPNAQDAVRTAVLDDLTSGAYDDLIRQVANEDEGWELTDPTSDTDSETDTDTGTSDNPSDSTDPKPDGSLPDDGSESESDSDTKDENKPDDEKSAFELPAFCSWATVVCDFIDWVKKPDDSGADGDVSIEKPQIQDPDSFDTDYVSFAGQCPVLEQKDIKVGAVVVPIRFDISPLCDFASAVKPAVLAMAYLYAMFIVSQAIRG